jgi:uridine kinase
MAKSAASRAQVVAHPCNDPSDSPAVRYTEVDDTAVLVFDGLFLLRSELRTNWDLTVYMRADRRREAAWSTYLEAGLPEDDAARAKELEQRLARARWPRYQQGWELYTKEAEPERAADLVIDNDDFAIPRLIRTSR